ncbi:MAG TPA: hypothetical protein VK745_14815 [Polyangiaceae bacterium]|nr:hypothetical protein [Polyangiaceae bacterium]
MPVTGAGRGAAAVAGFASRALGGSGRAAGALATAGAEPSMARGALGRVALPDCLGELAEANVKT